MTTRAPTYAILRRRSQATATRRLRDYWQPCYTGTLKTPRWWQRVEPH